MCFSNVVLSFLTLVAVFGFTQSTYAICHTAQMCYGQGFYEICTRTTSGQIVKHYNRCMKEKYDCEHNQLSQEVACPVPPMTFPDSNSCPTCNQPDTQEIICTKTRDGRTVKHYSRCMKNKFVCENNESSQEVACPAANPCPTCTQPDTQEIICTKTRDGQTVKHFSRCMKNKFVCENNESSQEVACPAANPCPTCTQPDTQEIICTKTRDGQTVKHFSRCMKNKFVCENNESSQEVACPAANPCPTCTQPDTQEIICTKTRDGQTVKHFSRCMKNKFVCENNESSQEVACPAANPCPTCTQPDTQEIICTKTRDGQTVKHFSRCMKNKFVCENNESSQEVACPAVNPCPTCTQPDTQEIICTKTRDGRTVKHYSRCMKNKFVCENNELSQEVACPVPPMTFPDTNSCPTCNQPDTQELICTKTRDGRTVKHFSRCMKNKFVCENNESSQEVACPAVNPCPSCTQPDTQEIICTKTRDGRTVKHYSRCMKNKFVCENNEFPQEVACPVPPMTFPGNNMY